MIFAVIAISVVIGFVVAAGVVGTQAQRLGRQRREPVWRLAEAAQFVADRLPFEIAAGLNSGELEALLRAHLNLLQFGQGQAASDQSRLGRAGSGQLANAMTQADSASDAQPDTVLTAGPVVTEDSSFAAELYRSVRRDGLEISLEQVQAAAEAHLDYLRLIGALAAADAGDAGTQDAGTR